MSKHGKRLLSGVRELVRVEGTSLEDLHLITTDLVVLMDRRAEALVKKLKAGQEIKIYDEKSNKEYGTKGSSLTCFFFESYETKTAGKMLSVYDDKQKKWSVSIHCLLDVFDNFDPLSEEGKKRISKSIPKKRGRKPKNRNLDDIDTLDSFQENRYGDYDNLGFDDEEEGSFGPPEWQEDLYPDE